MSNIRDHLSPFVREYSPLLFLSIAAFLLTRYSITYGAGSDPRYTLIVSQSLIENGAIQLNAYQNDEIWGAPADFDNEPNILNVDGRYYSYFPAGPSLLSLPAVLVTKAAGWDMRRPQDNVNAQRLLSSLSVVVMIWLVYGIARAYLPRRDSLVITAVSIFGSTLISTLGVALWSINYSVIFIGLSLLLIVRYDSGHSKTVHPWPLGSLLFLAYFSRAASAAFILPVFLYLLLTDWRQMVKTAVTAAALLLLFLLWSKQEFGSWLPIYYSAARLQAARDPFWLALYGHLFSPSRGFFVFMPFFLLVVLRIAYCVWNAHLRNTQYAIRNTLLLWIGLHLLIASRAATWWGGDSFGPRILTELVLAFTLLTILLWAEARERLSRRQRQRITAVYLLLGLTAVFIHSYQGLYNNSTAVWNAAIQTRPAPPFTPPRGDLFNWRIPQFAATNDMLCRLEEARARAALAQSPLLQPYAWGRPLTYGPDVVVDVVAVSNWLYEDEELPQLTAVFLGWGPIDNDRAPHRALVCPVARIFFLADEAGGENYQLVINTAAFGAQRAIFSLNDYPLGEWTFTQQPGLAPETAVLPIPAAAIRPHAVNQLAITLPDARRARANDPARLSLAPVEITIDFTEKSADGADYTDFHPAKFAPIRENSLPLQVAIDD
ncbi:MAG TPA: hypothetical protein ENK32_04275 [Anaerolineae bacterium]|nr:hypothetical protein [Anaerolineae bacterium]